MVIILHNHKSHKTLASPNYLNSHKTKHIDKFPLHFFSHHHITKNNLLMLLHKGQMIILENPIFLSLFYVFKDWDNNP